MNFSIILKHNIYITYTHFPLPNKVAKSESRSVFILKSVFREGGLNEVIAHLKAVKKPVLLS